MKQNQTKNCPVCIKSFDNSSHRKVVFCGCQHIICNQCLVKRINDSEMNSSNCVKCINCSNLYQLSYKFKHSCCDRYVINEEPNSDCQHFEFPRNTICYDYTCQFQGPFCTYCASKYHKSCRPAFLINYQSNEKSNLDFGRR